MESSKDKFLLLKKYLPYILSPIVSVALFVFMGFLIFEATDLKKEKSSDPTRVEFLRTYKESSSEKLEKFKPKKQEASVDQQPIPPMAVSSPQAMAEAAMNNNVAPPTGRTFDASMTPGATGAGVVVGGFAISGVGTAASAGTGVFGGGGTPGVEGAGGLTPLVRVKCEPPNQARVEGIKGSIVLKYDVNSLGQTENIQVVDANPSNVFEQNCIRAVQQWRFKPKMIDGRAVAVRGSQYKFNFGDYSGTN